MVTRTFTRADIEAFFNKHWGKSQEPKNELSAVRLLPELEPPCWHIRYMALWHKPYEHSNYYSLLVIQKTRVDGTLYLNLPDETELPEGLATPAEEDAEIARRKQ